MIGDGIVIGNWMLNLGLNGEKELIAYAAVFRFSQADFSWFREDLPYIAEWISSTEQEAAGILSSLVERGYLERRTCREGDNVVNEYHVAL